MHEQEDFRSILSAQCGPTHWFPTVVQHATFISESCLGQRSHRGQPFHDVYKNTDHWVKLALGAPTSWRVFFPGMNATAAMAATVNLVGEGEVSAHILNGENATFAKKWMKKMKYAGKLTTSYTIEAGKPIDFSERLFDKSVRVICVTQNETSNGIWIPPNQISLLKKNHPWALVLVDGVSSTPFVELEYEFIDGLLFSTQKGWTGKSGLGVLMLSPEAVVKAKTVDTNFYPSILEMETSYEKNETVDTMSIDEIQLLGCVAKDMCDIGMSVLRERILKRSEILDEYVATHHFFSHVVEEGKRSYTIKVVDCKGKAKEICQYLFNLPSYRTLRIDLGQAYDKDLKPFQIRIPNFGHWTDGEFDYFMLLLEEASMVVNK